MTAAPLIRFSVPTLLGPEPLDVAEAITSGSLAAVVAVRGATPVFADVDERTLTPSPALLEQHLTD